LDATNFTYKWPERWKYSLSTIVGIGAVTLTETVKLPIPLFGTPDIYDIPAGILGVACYLGVNLWANRLVQTPAVL
jgi:hypothetical protein